MYQIQVQQQRTRAQMLRRRAVWVFLISHYDLVEFAVGLVAFCGGLLLLLPAHTFDTGMQYSVMRQVASETIWGAALFVVGALHLVSFFHEWRRGRVVAAALSMVVWFFVSAAFFRGNHIALGNVAWPTFFCGATWTFIRLNLKYAIPDDD